MFENLLNQERTRERLHREVELNRLPPSLMFYGPEYAGKMTAALELARVLSCRTKGAPWNCPCPSCSRHRLLESPYLLLLGSRSFREEIAAAGAALLRTGRDGSRYLYIRSIRKLTRRFDSALWPGEDKTYRKAVKLMAELNDNLDGLTPGDKEGPEEDPAELVKQNLELCGKLEALLPKGNIPVQQVRQVLRWIHTGSSGETRVVILEQADAMQESSRNALLKILEEPPEGVYLILLTTRRSAIMPTILSRVRPYAFTERAQEAQKEVLERIFQEDSGQYTDIRSFFLAWRFEQPVKLREQALSFIRSTFSDQGDFASLQLDAAARKADPRLFDAFLVELSGLFQELLRGREVSRDLPSLPSEQLRQWNELLRTCRIRREKLNQNPALLLENLYYKFRGTAGTAGGRG